MKKILIIEDEPLVLKVIDRLLIMKGYYTDRATNGKEALDQLQKSQFDLIITDIRMPEKNGWDVISYLCESSNSTKILAISGYSQNDLDRAVDLGANQTLTKPFFPKQLSEAVEKLLGSGSTKTALSRENS